MHQLCLHASGGVRDPEVLGCLVAQARVAFGMRYRGRKTHQPHIILYGSSLLDVQGQGEEHDHEQRHHPNLIHQ